MKKINNYNRFDNAEGFPVTFTNSSIAGISYKWNFGHGDASDEVTTSDLSPVEHSFPFPGYFHVTLTVTGPNPDCIDTQEQDIYILPAVAGYNQFNCVINKTYTNHGHVTITAPVTTWDEHKTIKGTLTIKSGSHLIVNPGWFIRFGPQGKVVVEHNAELTINGATFTSNTAMICGSRMMWQGIEVWGNDYATLPYGEPGKLNVINNALIEDAYNGITVGKWELRWLGTKYANNGRNKNFGGGVINVTDSRFNRNYRSIVFWDRVEKNLSVISNNQFTSKNNNNENTGVWDPYFLFNTPNTYSFFTDITFPTSFTHNPHLGFQDFTFSDMQNRAGTFIFAFGADRLRFLDNEFDNATIGIQLWNTRSFISGNTITRNTFTNISSSGIQIANTISPAAYIQQIIANNFNSNVNGGIGITGSQSADLIEANVFNNTTSSQLNNSKGISTSSSFNFRIIDNHFSFLKTGIDINNSGNSSFSLIGYRNGGNVFQRCSLGVATAGNNLMLNIRCNNFDNPDPGSYGGFNWDINGPLSNQGKEEINSEDHKSPAGNRFNQLIEGFPRREIHVYSPTKTLYYYRHIETYTEPVPVNSNCIVEMNDVYFIDANTSCAPDPGDGSLSGKIATLNDFDTQVELLVSEYNLVSASLDKGETTTLIEAINSNTPEGALKNMLVNSSPLSDEVLRTFINRSSPTPPGIFKLVMDPNLPVSDEVFPLMESYISTMPEGTQQEIMEKQVDNPTAHTLTSIAREITYLEKKRQEVRNDLLEYYVSNDMTQEVLDLLSGEQNLEARRLYAATLIHAGSYSEASQVIAGLPETSAGEINFKNLYSLYLNLAETGRTIFEMSMVEIETVRQIASACPALLAEQNARAAMSLVTGELFPECVLSSAMSKNNTKKENQESDFSAMKDIVLKKETAMDFYLGANIPNPFNKTTRIPYAVKNGRVSKIMVYDLYGKLIREFVLSEPRGVLELSLEQVLPGIYLYKLVVDGAVVQNRSMVITN